MNFKLMVLLSFVGLGTIILRAAAEIKTYSIELPHYTLQFSLPKELAVSVTSKNISAEFDPQDADFSQSGYIRIVAVHCDFAGPFWAGAYGTLTFDCLVHKRDNDFVGSIASVADLERYVTWRLTEKGQSSNDWYIAQMKLRSVDTVCRMLDTFGSGGPLNAEPYHIEGFSMPLDESMYLDCGIKITCWEAGRKKVEKWMPKAEAMREAIKASIMLKPKSPGAQNQANEGTSR